MAPSPGSRKQRADPRRRLRGHRRRAQAEGRRRRRRARRPARLPHLPAAALPGRDRPARARRRSGIRCATSSTTSRTSRVHQDAVTAIDLDARAGAVRARWRRSPTTTSCSRSAPRSTSSASRARPSTRSRCTRSPTPCGCKDHVLERWEAADRDPALIDDGALNVVVVGGGPTGVESAGALAELYRSDFAKDYPDVAAGAGAADPRRGRARRSSRCSSRTSAATRRRRSRSAASRCMLGEIVASVDADARHAQVGRRCSTAHTLVWGAGLQAQPARRSRSASSSSAATASPVGPDLTRRRPSRGVRRRRHRVDHRHEDRPGAAAARLGRAAVGRARRREHRARSSPARRRSRSTTRTRARWRRSAAAPPSCSCTAAGR